MSYNRENYIKVKKSYEGKNLRAKERAMALCDELHKLYPELKEIDTALRQTGFKVFEASLMGKEGLEERLALLKKQNMELQQARGDFLEFKGYSRDYTDVKYECDLCKDVGSDDNGRMCSCMKKKLILEGYKSSGIGSLIDKYTFDKFDISYYSDTPGAKDNAGMVLEFCRKYAREFSDKTSRNVLLCGTTGLGKTHLSTAIAKEVIDRGFDVVYDTAQNVMQDFEDERFSKDYNSRNSEKKTDKYFECDLLIIDDLGTEMSNQFTVSCVYNIINTRINREKPMIINTNLMQNELRERYADRITSRLFGEFMPLVLTGKDIRAKKLFK